MMEITGEYRIAAPRALVWEALNDPAVLRAAIPGVESFDKKSDTEFIATVTVKIGPVKARFKGSVTLSELDPPHGYQIKGEGQGGVAGFARGTCEVKLYEESGETLLRYHANAQVGGKLAQVGSRMISGVVKKLGNEFFSAFAGQMSSYVDSESISQKSIGAAERTPSVAIEQRETIAPGYWIVGLVIIVGFLLWLYS